jgi:hypothetical protein
MVLKLSGMSTDGSEAPPQADGACGESDEDKVRGGQRGPWQRSVRSRLLRRRAPTLRQWCGYWLDTDTAKRPKSKKEDASTLELHVYPDLGDARIDAITRHDVQMLASAAVARSPASSPRRAVAR